MKKRILTVVLGLVLVMGLTISGGMAAGDSELVLEMNAFNSYEATLSADDTQVAVKAYDDIALNEAEVKAFYRRAQEVKSEEVSANISSAYGITDCFEYTLYTDDATWFYEETISGDIKNLYVFAAQMAEETVVKQKAPNTTRVAVNLKDGFGGRLKYATSYGTYISCVVQTPVKSQVVGVNNTTMNNYIYVGFSGKTAAGYPVETDAGLQYSTKQPSIGGWNHYLKVNSDTVCNPASGFTDVTGNNFFLTSDSSATRNILLTTYKNYGNKVRSKAEGYARYNNSAGTGNAGAYYKTSVKESNIAAVATVSSWKLLNTITAEYSGFASWCKFTNINLDGATPSQIYITPEEDHAAITPVYSGGKLISAEIAVSW